MALKPTENNENR